MYFITGLREEGDRFIARHCFGFFSLKDLADQAISENSRYLHENTFTHLVIEKCLSGLGTVAQDIAWYRFDRYSLNWISCERPESAKNYFQFSLG